tara:strand:+ start:177 stop:845 length:669 start_codon:yes stop_codon:yes gene_type:complete
MDIKNTLILLIDFEGEVNLQDQNYLNNRFIALLNILKDRKIDREKCIVVFNTYDQAANEKDHPYEWGKVENPKLKSLVKYAWVQRWNVYHMTKETNIGHKDIDIETFIKTMKEKRPEFNIDPNETNILIGGTETAGCILSNKKLGALNWSKKGYDTSIYLPLCAEYSTRGNTWYEKQQAAFAHFWSTIKKHEPKDYRSLNILHEYMQIIEKLPISDVAIKPM